MSALTQFEDDPTRWTVHVLGADDVHYFDRPGEAFTFLGEQILELRRLFPRASEYDPMIRLVVSPPTEVAS